jgi:signal transduction histidine kinase
MFAPRRSLLQYTLTGIWLLFMISLSVWWLIFGMRQLDRLMALGGEVALEFGHQQKMLVGEGVFLVVGLLAGGVALFYFTNREARRHRQVEEFFSAFTHDLKTSLSRLRLQIESLQEDIGRDSPLVDRLIQDSVRLQMQLENSLYLSNLNNQSLFSQPIVLGDVISTVRHSWPDLEIDLEESPKVMGDLRALESVIRNIISNAQIHGHANLVSIKVNRPKSSRVRLVIEDNGEAVGDALLAKGSRSKLMQGTGMGLFIADQLMDHMGGKLEILPPLKQGFRVALEFDEVL